MSQEVGNAIKQIIKDKKITNFQLAKEVGVDRTTFQHFLSGKRKMNLEDLQRIMEALSLTKDKKRQLYSLYENEYDDREVLKNTYDIFSLYRDLSNHTLFEDKWIESEEYLVKNELTADKTRIIKGQVKIEGIIRSCFLEEMGRSEDAHVIMSVNFKHYFLYELIMRIANGQNKCGRIQNIIPLVNKKKLGNNLDILKTVLLLKGFDTIEYEPYYFYSGTKIYDDISIIVPNYFITSKQVITIDRDFESAIIYEDSEILDYYQKKSQAIISKCTRFVEKERLEIDKLPRTSFERVSNNKLIKYISYDQLDNLINLENCVKDLETLKQKLKGSDDETKSSEIHIIRDELLGGCQNLCIRYQVNEEKIEFFLVDENKKIIKNLIVKEIGIVILFKEFFNYLPSSVHVFSAEEMNNIFRNVRGIPVS